MIKIKYKNEISLTLDRRLVDTSSLLCGNLLHWVIAQKEIHQGIVVLEHEPQTRMLICDDEKSIKKIHFPYIIQVIGYFRDQEKYLYPGILSGGLRVYFNNKPLQSINDEVWFSPLDANYYGFSCTPHAYDSKIYNSLKQLTDHTVSLWFNQLHDSYAVKKLSKNTTIDRALSCKDWYSPEYCTHWNLSSYICNKKTLFDCLKNYAPWYGSSKCGGIDRLYIPEGSRLVEEDYKRL
jgi:hypothetical protein